MCELTVPVNLRACVEETLSFWRRLERQVLSVQWTSCKSKAHSKYGLHEATMKLRDAWSWEWVLTGAVMGVLVAIRGPAAGNRHTCWWEWHLYDTHTRRCTHMLTEGGQIASALPHR